MASHAAPRRSALVALFIHIVSAATIVVGGTAYALTPLQGDEVLIAASQEPEPFSNPDIATDGNRFVVAWQHSQYSIHARIVEDVTTGDTSAPVVVNEFAGGTHRRPSTAVQPDGSFVVVWSGAGPTDDVGIFARRFDPDGTPLMTSSLVNGTTSHSQNAPDVAAHPDGGFVVVWVDADCSGDLPLCGLPPPDADGDRSAIRARRLDATGAPVGSAFLVNTSTVGRQRWPAVAVNATGESLVVWTDVDAGVDGDASTVLGQVFDSSGTPAGTEFVVNTYTPFDQEHPAVTAAPDGRFVVAWQSAGQADRGPSFARFAASGAALGAETEIPDAPSNGRELSVTVDAFQRVTAGWEENGGLHAQRFDASDAPIGPKFTIGAYGGDSFQPRIVGNGAGQIVAVWILNDSPSEPVPRKAVFASPHCVDDAADADGDGIGDTCDPCDNLGDRSIDVKPRLGFKFIGENPIIADDRVGVSGEFSLPAGMTFADIAPTVDPVRIRIQTAGAAALLDTRLTTAAYGGAGTGGWSANPRGTTWKFVDRTSEPRSGIVSLVLKDRGENAPGRVRFKVKGRGGVYPVFPGDEPLAATILFGSASAGECAETAFVASDCRFTGANTRVGCSR